MMLSQAVTMSDAHIQNSSSRKWLFLVVIVIAPTLVMTRVAKQAHKPNPLRELLVDEWLIEDEPASRPFCFYANGSYSDKSSGIDGKWRLSGDRLTMTYWAPREDWYFGMIPKTTEEFDVYLRYEEDGDRLAVNLANEPPHVFFRRKPKRD